MASQRLQKSLRVTLVGMAVNAVLAAGKLVAGIFGHSHALIADAVESLADVFASIITWRGLVVAAAPADADHPYGHGKAEPLAAAGIATILLFSAFLIASQAFRELFTARESPAPFTLGVLLLTVFLKEGLFRFAFRAGDRLESALLQTEAWHHRSDALTSLAAALGIGVALLGGPKWARADSIAAIVAAGLIAWNGTQLLRPALAELMDTAPGRKFENEIRKIAGEISGVDNVEKCFIRKMGCQYFVDLHIEVNPQMSVQMAHDIAHQVKDRIREQEPAIRDVLVHIEPSGRATITSISPQA